MGIFQQSVAVRNARLDGEETAIGTTPLFRIYTFVGAMPADCSAAAVGVVACTITLPTDWLANAASGAKAKSGTWSAAVTTPGDGHYWRLLDSTGTTTHYQGPAGRAWATATAYTLGQRVTNANNAYRCTTAIPASATAPTGTTTSNDGAGVWTFESNDSGFLVLDAFALSGTLTIPTFTVNAANA